MYLIPLYFCRRGIAVHLYVHSPLKRPIISRSVLGPWSLARLHIHGKTMLETLQELAAVSNRRDSDFKPKPRVHVDAIPDDSSSDAGTQHQDPESQPSDFDLRATHLIASPYPDRANQLDLQMLDPQSRLFAFALTALTPTTPTYATAPYTTAFNWPTVFSTLRTLCSQQNFHWRKQEFYVVIFRSKLREGAERARLGELDQKAHEEACASGGLLKYWFGRADGEGRNLATCMPLLLPKSHVCRLGG